MKPRYNIAPTELIPVFKTKGNIEFLRWGFKPHYASSKIPDAGFINVRAETIRDRITFRQAFERQRCVIIADGFYEWKTLGRIKQPFYIQQNPQTPFLIAGIWQEESCAIITTAAIKSISQIHERMPLVFNAEQCEIWLNRKSDIIKDIMPLMQPNTAQSWRIIPVSMKVNRSGFEGPECIQSLH